MLPCSYFAFAKRWTCAVRFTCGAVRVSASLNRSVVDELQASMVALATPSQVL